MGITTENFFESVYNIIFEPDEFFKKNDYKSSVRLAIATVAIIAALSKLSEDIFAGKADGVFYLFGLLLFVAGIILTWFLTALFFEYVAKIFDRGGKLNEILYFTAFATVPYIFFAPLNLLKITGDFGFFAGSICELLLYARIIFLYAYSLKITYDITYSRAFMFLFIPFVSLFFIIYWSLCFFYKIGYIFSI